MMIFSIFSGNLLTFTLQCDFGSTVFELMGKFVLWLNNYVSC